MPEPHIDETRCVRCGECAEDCTMRIISMDSGLPAIAPERQSLCIECQHCLAVCPTGAFSILGKRPEDSRELPGDSPSLDAMETLVMGRRSVRRYRPEAVAPELIDRLLAALAYAPAGRNNQNRLLTVVDDPNVMEQYRKLTYHGLELAARNGAIPDSRALFARLPEVYAQGNDAIFRGAPHMLVASGPASSPTPEVDCHIALSQFELLAVSAGLGTLWCGMAKWAMELLPEMRLALALPEDHLIGYVMLFGLPAVSYPRTPQKGPARVRRLRLKV